MKYATEREYADPEKAARKLLEIANTVEAIQDGRIYIEKLNGPFLFKDPGRRGLVRVESPFHTPCRTS